MNKTSVRTKQKKDTSDASGIGLEELLQHPDEFVDGETRAQRNHRVLGFQQELFTASPYSPGSPLFLPNGTAIVNKLIGWLRAQYHRYGFEEVLTPTIYKKSLWEISGHWQNYKDDMYEVRGRGASGDNSGEIGEDEEYGLKPMNCPGHCLLFKSQKRSYKSLPIRFSDFSPLHRNEISGALSGLTRVRRFHQDDGHIFCRPQQIKEEIASTLRFVDLAMRSFMLGPYRLVLSTRPKEYIGTLEEWEHAENQLREALDDSGKPWEVNEGDGAFYGPKIDILLKDQLGKEHQLATTQLDLFLPQRFELEYVVPPGELDYNPNKPGSATPIMIHRAVFGSLERFLALLIEHYDSRWPFWLSPVQGIIVTAASTDILCADNPARRYNLQVENIRAAISGIEDYNPSSSFTSSSKEAPLPLSRSFFNIDLDDTNRSLSKKISDAKRKKYNFIMVVGRRNLEEGTVDVDISAQLAGMTADKTMEVLKNLGVVGSEFKDARQARMKMRVEDVHRTLQALSDHMC